MGDDDLARPPKPAVDAATFYALDLRIGRVIAAEPFPEARTPSLKLTVDFGVVGVLRTSARITNYDPASLVDTLVVGVVNIGTKRIAGFTSQFLVLGAIEPDGTVRLLQVEDGVDIGLPVE